MTRVSRIDAVFVAATVGVWLGMALWTSEAPIDRFFLAVLATCLLYLLRLGAVAWLGARHERQRAAGVRRLRPEEVAQAAVVEERARLSADIARCLRDSLAEVHADAHAAEVATEPVPALLRIQAHTRRATSELRRQLGLLRDDEDGADDAAPSAEADPAGRPSRRDLLLGAGVTTLALTEVTAYLLTEGYGDGSVYALPGSVAMSGLAAAAITLRRTAPVVASLWCAAVFGLGTLLGAPVGGGFWAIATTGSLAWTLAAATPARPATPLAWATLTGLILHSRVVDDPDNALIFGLLLGVATVLGLAVRLNRSRGRRAAASARTHEQSLQESARLAVTEERHAFAREIHDVVSHAVGLIAMQAGAAELSWPHDPDAARRSVDVISSTAVATLVEIDRLLPGDTSCDVPRLEHLVDRIRATGTTVHLVQEGEPDPALAPLAYRIVQEGLTNAVRHAPGAVVTVGLHAGDDGLVVEVADDGPGPDDRRQPGYGLIGLDERVSQSGGSLISGPGPGGRGFRLQARVPARSVQATP
jgi:signal transduction histidine kinase